MINYKEFINSKIIPNYGIDIFILQKNISTYTCNLEENVRLKLEKEFNKKINYFKLNFFSDNLILIFDGKMRNLSNIIINDKNLLFEAYYIGMTLEDALKIKTSIYDSNNDEDSIYHHSKGIKFNLNYSSNNDLIIKSIEIFNE